MGFFNFYKVIQYPGILFLIITMLSSWYIVYDQTQNINSSVAIIITVVVGLFLIGWFMDNRRNNRNRNNMNQKIIPVSSYLPEEETMFDISTEGEINKGMSSFNNRNRNKFFF